MYAADGEIVAAADGVSERRCVPIAGESWFAVKSMLTLRADGSTLLVLRGIT